MQQYNRRVHERFDLATGYTSVTATQNGRMWGGHAYDISEGGARIELDEGFDADHPVELALHLPGETRPLDVTASIVWVSDNDGDPGPRRLAVQFETFSTAFDRQRLLRYLGASFRTAA